MDRLSASIGSYITKHIVETGELDAYVKDIETRQNDPYTVVNTIMDNMLKNNLDIIFISGGFYQ